MNLSSSIRSAEVSLVLIGIEVGKERGVGFPHLAGEDIRVAPGHVDLLRDRRQRRERRDEGRVHAQRRARLGRRRPWRRGAERLGSVGEAPRLRGRCAPKK